MKINIKEMTLVSLFAALTAVGAFVSIPVGPVPITLQSLFVLLSGMVLGSKLGALSQVVYIVLGLIGIPIFAGGTGGFQTVLRPSFGFLIGFAIAAFIIGSMIKNRKVSFVEILKATLVGTIVIYLIGIPYMYYILNSVMNMGLSLIEVLQMGLILFIPGDVLKILISTFVGAKILPILKASNY